MTGLSMAAIALITDFDTRDWFVGHMHAALHALVPGAKVLDLMHGLTAFDIESASFLLPRLVRPLPAGCIVIVVVDPGVGSDRKAVIVEADDLIFVGPGTALFTYLERASDVFTVREIVWRPPSMSCSFHGRDWFAPVAARLYHGENIAGRPMGAEQFCAGAWPDALLKIIYVDHYGNCLTGIPGDGLPRTTTLQVNDLCFRFSSHYQESAEHGSWIVNSLGLVELGGYAYSLAGRYGLQAGDRVIIKD